jgi:hypothetical protein
LESFGGEHEELFTHQPPPNHHPTNNQPTTHHHPIPTPNPPLQNFEREHKELNMLLFPEVLERVARFDRVLARPGGSLLLCGPSGTGRRSCMTLMAYMHHMEFFSPKMTR